MEDDTWEPFLDDFHTRRPGITEDILDSAISDGATPYKWLLEVIPPEARLLDLACGSGPLLPAGWAGPWVGIDRSRAELRRARLCDGASLVAADAQRLPFGVGTFGAVACSMALMLLQPLDECLDEVARVLAPGGTLAVLLPGGPRPLRVQDMWAWGRLLVALRTARLSYPNDHQLRRIDAVLHRHHLTVVTDERRRFVLHFSSTVETNRFVDSLYLPQSYERRIVAAQRSAQAWVGKEIGIPLRRMVITMAS